MGLHSHRTDLTAKAGEYHKVLGKEGLGSRAGPVSCLTSFLTAPVLQIATVPRTSITFRLNSWDPLAVTVHAESPQSMACPAVSSDEKN